jgi:hypothetical protein
MTFRLAPLNDCQDRLKRDYIDFARAWAAAKEDWLDDRCRQFEQEHLTTLGSSLNRFTASLNEFGDAVRKAESALKDDQSPRNGLE